MSTTILWHTSSGAAGRVDDSSRNVGGLVEAGAGEGRQVTSWIRFSGVAWTTVFASLLTARGGVDMISHASRIDILIYVAWIAALMLGIGLVLLAPWIDRQAERRGR